MSKLLFDDTTAALPERRRRRRGAVRARARSTGCPTVIRAGREDAQDHDVDQERMGVPLDPLAPVDPNRTGAVRLLRSTIPTNVAFWWEHGAQTAWQTVAADARRRSTSTTCGSPTSSSRSSRCATSVGGDPNVARTLAQRPRADARLRLADRGQHVHLPHARRDAVDRAGLPPRHVAEQHHTWQATLDEHAIVFTTHPKNEPQVGTQWPDDDGYWTGTGSMPRERAARPRRDPPLRPGVRAPGAAARHVRLPRLHPRVLPAGALRRGRQPTGTGRSAARATATSRCGRGARPQWRDRAARHLHARAHKPFDLVAPRRRRQRVDRRGRRELAGEGPPGRPDRTASSSRA